MKRDSQHIKNYFSNAEGYEARIVPAFQHFAAGVVQTAQPQGYEITVDIGTGTGILARLISPHVEQVVGIDFVPQMIAQAQKFSLSNVRFQEADVHNLPFENETFDLAVSSFGLNMTQPRKAFGQLYRVLKAGGLLVFHEWGALHPLDENLIEVFAQYMVEDDDAPPELLDTREFIRTPRLWDNVLQDKEDFVEVLSEVGFSDVLVWEDTPVEVVLPVNEFMDYKLGWVNRQAELAAMDEYSRKDCLDAVRSLFNGKVDSEGNIHYAPMLFRVHAKKG